MYNKLCTSNLDNLKKTGQYRIFTSLNRICGKYPLAKLNNDPNKEIVVWCSNDYLGMSQNPLIIDVVQKAINDFGIGSGGSRNIAGTCSLHESLEMSIADWHSKESALIFPTGFSSNDATLQCMAKNIDNCVFISDAKNHASIINGISNKNVEKKIFKHNDMEHLEKILSSYPNERPKVILFESIYSMDGDISPIAEIVALAKKYNSLTYLDEVHAIGMYGPKGAGVAAKLGVAEQIDIIQGTMAKAIGIIGGYIASTKNFIDFIRSFATGFIFTTSLPPAIVAGCLASIDYLKISSKEREILQKKTTQLRNKLREKNIPVMACSNSHILPVLIGDAELCKAASDRLLNTHGIYLQPINYPSVEKGTERFRVNTTPNHTEKQINHLVTSLEEVFQYLNLPLQAI